MSWLSTFWRSLGVRKALRKALDVLDLNLDAVAPGALPEAKDKIKREVMRQRSMPLAIRLWACAWVDSLDVDDVRKLVQAIRKL